MKKPIKITLISLGGLIALLLILAIVLPILFKPQILQYAQIEINKRVNATVSFDDLNISLFKGFPNLYVSLEGVKVINKAPFQGDTLAMLDEFALRVNLMSLFDLSHIEVYQVTLDHPYVHAHRNALGLANWDIAIPSAEAAAPEEAEAADPNAPATVYGASLQRFEILHADLAYADDSTKMYARAQDLNFDLSGDLGSARSQLDLGLLIEKVFFRMGGVTYAPGLKVIFDAKVDADLEKKLYVLEDNTFALNAFALKFDGWVAMPGDSIAMDMKLGTKGANFKSLLSLVPAVFLKGYESLRAEGNLQIDGHVHGAMVGKELPSAKIQLGVRNAMLQYEVLPKKADNINIDLVANFNGKNQDATTLDLNRFTVSMAGNPVELTAHVRTPMSDPQVEATAKGHVDLGTVQQIVPLDSMTLSGILDLDLAAALRQSYIEQKAYDKCKLDGELRLQKVELEGVMPKPVKLEDLNLSLNPETVALNSLVATVGKSDVRMQGKLENFLPFVMTDGVVKGDLTLRSGLLDLNELFPTAEGDPDEDAQKDKDAEGDKPADTTAVDLSILRRVDFVFDAKLDQIYFQKMDIKDAVGKIGLRNANINLEELSCRMLEGKAVISGDFDFTDSIKPKASLKVACDKINVEQSVKTFSDLEKLLPIIQYVRGNVSLDFDAKTDLTPSLSLVLPSVQANGAILSSVLSIHGSPLFTKIGKALKNDYVTNPALKAATIPFHVVDGKVIFAPFKAEIAGISSTVGGEVSLEQTMDMSMTLQIPTSMLGKAGDVANNLMGKLSSNLSLGSTVPVLVRATGKVTDPRISFDIAKDTQKQVEAALKQKVEETKALAREKVREAADKLIREAEKRAQQLKDEAETLAQKTVKEAYAQAEKLRAEGASNGVFAKIAADKAAKVIERKGEQAADKIRSEAASRADELIERAKKEAEKLD